MDGYNYKYDISLPLHSFYDAVLEMRQRLGDSVVTCCGYGHIGQYRADTRRAMIPTDTARIDIDTPSSDVGT